MPLIAARNRSVKGIDRVANPNNEYIQYVCTVNAIHCTELL